VAARWHDRRVTTTPEPPAAEDRPPGPEPAAPPPTDRLLALSDGVVSIALTLLILQIAVPTAAALGKNPDSASALAKALADGSDDWISYGVSFYVIAQFWLNHHRVFRQIDKQIDGLAAWNFAFLFTISVMPFTSDLLGKFNSNPLAIDIFGFNLFLANLATLLMLEFGDRHQLFGDGIERDRFSSRIHILVGIVVGLISIALAWYNTTLAQCSWFLFAVVPQIADGILRLTGHPRRGRQIHI
jgi:uncharacterized membrane protein